MITPQLLSVTELRVRLPEFIKRAAAGEIFHVGAHRKAQAAVVGIDHLDRLSPPDKTFELMLNAMSRVTAHDAFCPPGRTGHARGEIWHPGDAFGRVLSWLWKTGRTWDAVELVADLMLEARYHYPDRLDFRAAFESLLEGIPLATSGTGWGVSDQVSDEMIETLRREVPKHYGQDLEEE